MAGANETEQAGIWDEVVEDEALEYALQAFIDDAPNRAKSRKLSREKGDAIEQSGVLRFEPGQTVRCGKFEFKIGETETKDIEFTRGGKRTVLSPRLIPE